MTEKTVPGIRSRGVRYWAERRGFRVVPPSTDVQDRLAGELPIDKPAGDRADLAPWSFDRDLRPRSRSRPEGGSLVFHVFGAIAHFRAAPDRRADQGWNCRRPCEGQASGTPTPRC